MAVEVTVVNVPEQVVEVVVQGPAGPAGGPVYVQPTPPTPAIVVDAIWVDVDDTTQGGDSPAPHSHTENLTPAEVLAGTNTTITRNADGTITISSTGGGGTGGTGALPYYHHVQNVISSTWVIDHPLEFSPHVTVAVNGGNGLIEAKTDVRYPSLSRVVVEMTQPATGEAFLT